MESHTMPSKAAEENGLSEPSGLDLRSSSRTACDAALESSRALLTLYLGPTSEREFAVRFWDGVIDAPPREPLFTIVLNHPESARRMLMPPSELRLGEAYVRGDFDIEGDVERATALGDRVRARIMSTASYSELFRLILQVVAVRRPRRPRARAQGLSRWLAHTRGRDAIAVRSHYDVGNDFYSLWLDRQLVYSCAYFETADAELEDAQAAKLDHICRKLRLQAGERFLDIGCGWGALIRFAARHFGVYATGITLSEAQADFAQARIADAGLADRCNVQVLDYRAIDARPFDKVASVGMFEHVGATRMREYFGAVYRVVRPGGIFLNHGIVRRTIDDANKAAKLLKRMLWREGEFMDRYVFSDGELIPLPAAIDAGEAAGFEVCDVETLRTHYAMTLRHWVRRLEARSTDAIRLVGAETYRVWRLYMAASAHAFASGRQGLAQILFARPDANGAIALPLTRRDLYIMGDM